MQLGLFDEAPAPPREPPYVVRRSARARRLSITVQPSGRVEVLAPRRASERSVARFVAEHSGWIQTTQDSFRRLYGTMERSLPRSIELTAIGHRVAVEYRRDTADAVRVRERGATLTLSGATNERDRSRDALKRWLAGIARRELGARLAALSEWTGLGYERIQVRAQKTCWGSRSSTGTISLNYCLLFLRPELVRYLLIHELSHSRHMNHSRRFWSLVGRFEPDYRRLDAELGEAWTEIPGWLDLY